MEQDLLAEKAEKAIKAILGGVTSMRRKFLAAAIMDIVVIGVLIGIFAIWSQPLTGFICGFLIPIFFEVSRHNYEKAGDLLRLYKRYEGLTRG